MLRSRFVPGHPEPLEESLVLALPLRIARMRLMLGQPLVADWPKLVQARRPLPADQEGREDGGDGSAAQDELKPDRHGAIVADSAHVRN